MAFCVSCGTQMADNAAFCPNCGKAASQVSGTGASAPPPTPVPPASYGNTNATAAPMAENVAGMLAYFTIIPAIIFLRDRALQSQSVCPLPLVSVPVYAVALFVIHVCLTVLSLRRALADVSRSGGCGSWPLALWLLLVIKAYQHEMFKLPIVGDLAEKQANA